MLTPDLIWYPVLPDPPQPPDLDYGSVILGDTSPPTNDIGVDGDTYALRNGSGVWIKTNNVWVAVSGTGTGSQEVYSGNWGGGYPPVTPTATQAIGIDTSDGTKWYWYGGGWH